jgi:FkbM family methyltransferase
MGIFYQQISKLPNYIKRFGVFHGLRLLIQIERKLQQKSNATRRYDIPGYLAPISLRETRSDHAIFFQCIVMKQYDLRHFPQNKRLMTAYHEIVERDIHPLIIDCGGNIGLATIWFAMLFPEATLYTIEPDHNNFEILKKNISCLGDRVNSIIGGVWNESGELRIVNPESGSAGFRVTAVEENSDNSIRAYTIDEICSLAGAKSPFIVKLDIEGAQANLFKSNTNWVSKTHLIILELEDWLLPWQGTSRSFFSCISQYAFEYLISGENIFCFRDFESES